MSNPAQRQLNRIVRHRLRELVRPRKLKPLRGGEALPAEVRAAARPAKAAP